MDLEILEKIGLSKAEVTIYLALLELGSVQSGRIVKETGLRKSTVYETVGRLQEKGLVSYAIKDSQKYFQAAHPDKLLDFVQEKKMELEKNEKEVADIIPKLRTGLDVLRPQAEAHVYSGTDGFKAMRRDVLRHAKGEFLLLGAISRESEVLPGFFEDWNKQRQKLKIRLRALHKEATRGKEMTRQKFMGKYFETRFLPEQIESPAVINIYGDRVVNVIWKNDFPVCFMLINRELANTYRQYFEYLWKISKS